MIIPHDKALHFIVGVLLYAVGHFVSVPVGLFLAFAGGFGKEVYDLMNTDRHTPELDDAVYTLAGGITGWICGL